MCLFRGGGGAKRPERGADHPPVLVLRLRMRSSYLLCACVCKPWVTTHSIRMSDSNSVLFYQYALVGHFSLSYLKVFQYAPNTHWIEGWLDSKAGLGFGKEKNLFPLARIEPRFFGIQPAAWSLHRMTYSSKFHIIIDVIIFSEIFCLEQRAYDLFRSTIAQSFALRTIKTTLSPTCHVRTQTFLEETLQMFEKAIPMPYPTYSLPQKHTYSLSLSVFCRRFSDYK
jgi:hypothetical protein